MTTIQKRAYTHIVHAPRRGTIMPMLAISMTALCGFVALAVDLGMISTARTQCQNAADAAALAGAASLDGSSSSNLSAASTNAVAAATANKILGANIPASEVTVRHGA